MDEFSRLDHTLVHKAYLNRFKRSMLSFSANVRNYIHSGTHTEHMAFFSALTSVWLAEEFLHFVSIPRIGHWSVGRWTNVDIPSPNYKHKLLKDSIDSLLVVLLLFGVLF